MATRSILQFLLVVKARRGFVCVDGRVGGEQGRRVEKCRDMRTGDEETVDNTYGIEVRDFWQTAMESVINKQQ